jgi:hypothetical protein
LAASHRSSQESEQSDQSDHVWAIKKSIKHIEEATRKPCITDCRSNPGSFLSERLPKPPSSMLQSACCLPHAGNATYLFATHRGFWQPQFLLVKLANFYCFHANFCQNLAFCPIFAPFFSGRITPQPGRGCSSASSGSSWVNAAPWEQVTSSACPTEGIIPSAQKIDNMGVSENGVHPQ